MSEFIKTGVIGYPVTHSLSPFIHNRWIAEYGLSGAYEALEIKPAQLEDTLKHLIKDEGYRGFNVTLPHKEAALDLCATLDDAVIGTGSVNTLVVNEDGTVHGRNTDAFGFAENIKTRLPDFDFADHPAVVLGAGGAARAVLYALQQEGCPQVVLANRTLEKAKTLAGFFDMDIRVVDWADKNRQLEGAGLLVNTTSLGMSGQPPLDIDLAALPDTAVVNDIVYKPLMTDLLEKAKLRGCTVVTGIGMLLHQARPGFETWYGHTPEVSSALVKDITERAAT